MCGIAGIVTARGDPALLERLNRMVKVQSHRGPNGEGRWTGCIGDTLVALGHSRLAILDLTEAGRQPMISACGRHVLIYNGEIYNYRELREELEGAGARFRTRSDTEVLLQALIQWGDQALPRFNGMWAFAWLDRDAGSLFLSRDRFGIKPLYLYRGEKGLFFASEIKSILEGSGEQFTINTPVVGRYLQQALLDAQKETFFCGIEALPAGHYMQLDLHGLLGSLPSARSYWVAPVHDAFVGTAAERIEGIRQTFFDAVRLRLRSDVPVGVLLSGGVDSSSIVTAMRSILGRGAELHIISAVSEDPRYDESPFIRLVTEHLGCQSHTVPVCVEPHEVFQLLDTVTWFHDEPVGSFSTVAHFQLMQRAKDLGVTVVLSGQGADELLCGYSKYLGFYLQSLLQTGRWRTALEVLSGFVRRRTVIPQFRLHEAKRYLPKLLRPAGIDIRGPQLKQDGFLLDVGLGRDGVVSRQVADLYRFSVPALVHFEDRMSMAWAREIRLPFLDFRLVTMLLPLAPEWKLRDGWTKWVFRKAMEEYLPPEITWRKDKQPFVIPQSEWLKHELQEKVEGFLNGPLLIAESGLVEKKNLQRRYAAYCQQSADRGTISFKDIFRPIALEIWARRFESNLRFQQ